MSEQEENSFEVISKTHYKDGMIDTDNCLPMILKSRKEELSTFDIQKNDIFFVKYPKKAERRVDLNVEISREISITFEEGGEPFYSLYTILVGKQWNEAEDQIFNIHFNSFNESMTWHAGYYELSEMEQVSVEEMGEVCKRILCYAVIHQDDHLDIPSLYLEFFDYFYGYQDILIQNSMDFLEAMVTAAGSDYEQNKSLNNFLRYIMHCVDTSYKFASKGSFHYRSSARDKRFLTLLSQELVKFLSALMKKNKFTHFILRNSHKTYTKINWHVSDEIIQMFTDIKMDLENRNLIFNETVNFLEKYVFLNDDYSPTFELLYYLPQAMIHSVIVFEAIEKCAKGKLDGSTGYHNKVLESVECVQFMFPELFLLLDNEKQLQAFMNKDVMHIRIDAENRVYRMLFKREKQWALTAEGRFSNIGGRINAIGWSNLAACDIYSIPYSKEVEAVNFPYKEDMYDEPDAEKKRRMEQDFKKRGKIALYDVLIKDCKDNGEHFYKKIFSMCEETSRHIEITLEEYYDHEKSDYNLVTPAEDEIYYLHRFLRKLDNVRTLFDKYQTKVFNIFIRYIEDTMRIGTALIFYWCLKEYWNKENLDKIEKKLKARIAAEAYFVSYFQAEQLKYNNTFKTHALSYPLAFCHAFVASKAIQKEAQAQANLLKLFCMTLHNAKNEKLRNVIYDPSPERRRFRTRIYYMILSAKTYIPLEVETIFRRSWPDVVNLYIWKAEICQYEKSTIETVRSLESGAFGVAEVVKVSSFALDVVAKYFTIKTNVADEIECLMKIQFNPNVVQIFGFVVDRGSYVGVLMEYCKGGSLAKVILSKKIYSEMHIIWWAMQAASGLAFLHRRNTIHRDVKPANMLLDENHDVLKIIDLGISKISPEPASPISEVDFLLSRNCGTIGFFPPNLSEYYSAAVDVFSLGRSIWSMIFRKQPFEDVVSQSLKHGVPYGISKELWEYVIRMMDLDERKRPTMEECYDFFKNLHGKSNAT